MKNRQVARAVNVALWIVVIAAIGYSSEGLGRWIATGFALLALGVHLFAFRAPAGPAAACCSFCGRPPDDARKMAHGPNVRICSSCIAIAQQVSARGDSEGRFPPQTK